MTFIRVAGNGTASGRSLWFWCPGCDDAHRVVVDAAEGWTWDGDETTPTVSRSILVEGVQLASGIHVGTRCHSFLIAGRWHFLGDCTHDLASQTVDMVPLPDWLDDEYAGC